MHASSAKPSCPRMAANSHGSGVALPPKTPPSIDTPEKKPVSTPRPGIRKTTIEAPNIDETTNTPTRLVDFFEHNANRRFSDASVNATHSDSSNPASQYVNECPPISDSPAASSRL